MTLWCEVMLSKRVIGSRGALLKDKEVKGGERWMANSESLWMEIRVVIGRLDNHVYHTSRIATEADKTVAIEHGHWLTRYRSAVQTL